MKKKPLSYCLDLIKFALEKQDWNKAKRYGEIVLKKLDIFSYSPREEYLLYGRIGYAFLQLAEYSRSLDNYYKAYLIATKHHLSPVDIDHTSHMMGHIFVFIGNLNKAITQFQKVEQSGYDSSLPNTTHYIRTLIDLGYCYLYKNDIEKVRELIETKLSPCLSLSDKLILKHYYHFKGEYLTATGEYNQARELFRKSIDINKELNLPKLILDINLHLAVIDLLEGQLKLGIKNLESLLKESRRLKLNDLICEIGLLLSTCYTLKNMPNKAASIERQIKPFLNKLDIVWLYEITRQFEQLYRQLQSIYQTDSNPIPTILTSTLNHHYEKSDYKHIIVGQSAPMRDVYQLIEKVAPTDLPILIQGETGTGKELIARALHHQSLRKENVWLALNCGAVPETLLENELFGHTKGAFTDAKEDKKGYIELASAGTLFMDEIAEMSPSMQQKLLRVLEEKLIWQLGAQKPIPVNTRFIFASNQDIEIGRASCRERV
jgi:transcriptional regulator with PAS, ATPase and Fis domain